MIDSEAGTEDSGIRLLGPLFRTTEVFLWEDVDIIRSGAASRKGSLSSQIAASFSLPKSCVTVDEETNSDHTVTSRLHLYGTVEEPELAYEMDVLGLPLSFGTSKVSINIPSRSKRKSTKPKSVSRRKDINKPVSEVTVLNDVENAASSKLLHDSPNMSSCLSTINGQTDSYHGAKEQCKDHWHSEESVGIAALVSRNVTDEKPDLVDGLAVNNRNIIKSEVSLDTVCFESNAEVLGSLSLCGDNCPKEVFEEACFQPEFQQDLDLLNKDDVEKCSVDSCTSFYSTHSEGHKAETETMQMCSVSAESLVFHPLDDRHDNFVCGECGNWRVIWDSFYKSNYFVNVESHESTWYPPPGLEKYAFSCSNLSIKEPNLGPDVKDTGCEHACGSIDKITDSLMNNEGSFHLRDKQPVDEQPDEQPFEKLAKIGSVIDSLSHGISVGNENSSMQRSLYPSLVMNGMKADCKDFDKKKEKQDGMLVSYYCSQSTINEDEVESPDPNMVSSIDVLESYENVGINKKRRFRRPQSSKGRGLTQCISNILVKYWCQRYSLFARFDDGIKMDDESLFSVTPELIAKHHAFRCGGGSIIDCFTGVGGNAIQFAMRTNHVIAIDVDPVKIDYAHHNAVIYGVSERIDFIKGDFFKIAPNLKGDVAFLSPPWGGPDYAKAQTYDIGSLKPYDGHYLFKVASRIAAKIVMFLPRNVNLDQLADLSLSTDPPWKLEVEKNYLNGKLKAITAYFDSTGE